MSDAPAIHGRIADIMREIGAIGKDGKNTQQNYKFRGIDQVLNTMHPILAKHGVFVVPRCVERVSEERKSAKGGVLIYTHVRAEFDFMADDGSSVTVATYGEGMDSGDKSTNKAMSAAMKYAYLFTFAIPTEDVDEADYDSPEPAPRQQRQPNNGGNGDARSDKIELIRDALHEAGLHTKDAQDFLINAGSLRAGRNLWQAPDHVIDEAYARPQAFVNAVNRYTQRKPGRGDVDSDADGGIFDGNGDNGGGDGNE